MLKRILLFLNNILLIQVIQKEMYHQLKKEGIQMSYTVEDFKREVAKKTLHELSRANFKKGGIFLALKGLHIPAQGNALGNC
jgi:hypothetical protein